MSLKYYKEEVDGIRTKSSEMRKEIYRLNKNLDRKLLQVFEVKQMLLFCKLNRVYELMIIYLSILLKRD